MDIQRTLKLKNKPETVFTWLTQPDYLQQWFADSAERADDSLSFKWTMQDGSSVGFDVHIIIEDAPDTFAYQATDSSEITTRFDITSDDDDIVLTMLESGFSDDDAGKALQEEHAGGWDWFLSRLQTLDV